MQYEISLLGGTRTVLTCEHTDDRPSFSLYVQESLAGKILRVEAQTEDGGIIETSAQLGDDGHSVTFQLDRNLTARSGSYPANLVTYDAGMKKRKLYPLLTIQVRRAAKKDGEQENVVSPAWMETLEAKESDTAALAKLNKSRIDTFTALPASATAGDAELADIRVGANSHTYASAGEAVREQIADVMGDVENLRMDYAANVYSIVPSASNLYIDTDGDGSVKSYDGYDMSDYILVSDILVENGRIVYRVGKSVISYALSYCAVYDKEKKYLSRITFTPSDTGKSVTVELPAGTVYLRCSFPSKVFKGFKLYKAPDHQMYPGILADDHFDVCGGAGDTSLQGHAYMWGNLDFVKGQRYTLIVENSEELDYDISFWDGDKEVSVFDRVGKLSQKQESINLAVKKSGKCTPWIHADVPTIASGTQSAPFRLTLMRADQTAEKTFFPAFEGDIDPRSHICKDAYISVSEASPGTLMSAVGWYALHGMRCDGYASLTIDLRKGEKVTASEYNCFYDADYNFLSRFEIKNGAVSEIPIPSDAIFFSISSDDEDAIKGAVITKKSTDTPETAADAADLLTQSRRICYDYDEQVKASASGANPVITFLYFSDIHGRARCLQDVMKFYESHASQIDEIVSGGDNVNSSIQDGMDYWHAIPGTDRILTIPGNHEHIDQTTKAMDVDPLDVYNLHMKDRIDGWGVAHSGANLYWYKDYPDSRLRLVAIDSVLDADAGQKAWFTSVLTEAKAKGYAVLGLQHYPANSGSHYLDCGFSAMSPGWAGGAIYGPEVDAFIRTGGEFVGWLTGHTHCDMVHRMSDTTQTFYTVTSCWPDTSWGDQHRDMNDSKTRTAFNLVSVDTTGKLLKIVRVGPDCDRYMRARKYMTVNYLTGKIIVDSCRGWIKE